MVAKQTRVANINESGGKTEPLKPSHWFRGTRFQIVRYIGLWESFEIF